MKTPFPRSWLLVAACLCLGPDVAGQNGLLREVYNDVSGGLDGLRSNPDFPGSPTLFDVIPEFETPGGIGDFYGQRVRGYVEAPQTGNYTFWIASDDQSELYLATDEQPQNASIIAEVFNWTDSRQWDAEPNQRSQSIRLEQGRRYYIEALHVEGEGGDHLAVRWQLPDGTIEEPIPNNRVFVELIGPQISRQPANVVVTEGQSATFAVELSNLGPVSVQWLRNGVAIPGATNLALFLPTTSMADSGNRFQARLTNRFAPAGVLSSEAFLTVSPDLIPPALLAAHASGDNDLVTLVFSEPVEAASALSLVNYSISGGVQVLGAAMNGDGRTVILRTTPLLFGETYEVFVEGLRDRANNANSMVESERAEFMYGFTPLPPDIVLGKSEKPGPSTRRTALVISEIMYNPTPRGDERNLEFIELYNSQESLQTISGYRLTGPIEYTFPEGTFIAARTNLVIAAVPADVQAVYGLPRVYGPYTNNLPDSGTLRLLNNQGAVLLEVPYSAEGEWPVAPDGGGPSLVLTRASYGEADPRAWGTSEFVGGTPGKAEPVPTNPYHGLVINEFVANSEPPAVDFIELYNYSGQEIDLSGVYLSDSGTTLKFKIPDGTKIGPLQHRTFTETELGFALSSGGERIFLRNPPNTRVIDAVRFGAQATGVARGRFPDGNPEFRTLSRPTADSANARPELPQIVINEIMYNPVSGNQDEEYVELYNRGSSAVNLRGWRLQDGVSFTFTQDFILAPGAYLIVAKDLPLLRANHSGLNAANSIGNFNGNLGNSGERIALERPEISIAIEGNVSVTNVLAVLVDEVTYGTGGRWPKWADGGGSSLELVDSESDNDDASNWADSDETHKSSWVPLEYRGILDHGASNFAPTSPSRNLHVLLMDAGEALLDNVQVARDGGRNLVTNPGFENGLDGWLAGGTHEESSVEPGSGPDRSAALHIRATERGDTAANRLRVRLSEALTNGTIATIRTQARWLRGTPEILLRLHGNYLELAGTVPVPKNLGTPGTGNSRRVANTAPSIAQARHFPALPVANQPVEVIARIDDPDQIALAQLFYRVDPATNYTRVPMVYRGAGYYSAAIPGQNNLATVAFYIEALDSTGASSRFPALPASEGVILFGDGTPTGGLSTYRLWLTQRNLDRWQRREQSSNKPLDATFVYNDERVIYNMGAHYSGSPFHWRGYSGPLGSSANYMMTFPDDDLFLGQTDFVLMLPSNLGSDATGVREQVFFWMADQLKQPFNHRRYHHLYLNGRNRGMSSGGVQRVYEDTQQPNRDMIEQWYPLEAEGDLFKIEDWFEFSDSYSFANRDGTLIPFVTTNLSNGQAELKRAPYRWMFRKRAVRDSAHDYSELLRLVAAANNPDPEEYLAQTRALVDIDEWMGVIALRHVSGDWDGFGYGRGKNMYAYKPINGKWRLMHWDIAFGFGIGDGPQTDLFATIEEVTAKMMETPEFRRAYLRALSDAANGPMVAARVNAVIDAKFLGLVQNGIAASSPETVKRWIAERRSFMLQELAGVNASFAITSNNGNNFTTNRNSVLLRGNAPVQVKTLLVNGVEYPVRWTSLTGWELRLALRPQQNLLRIEGYDSNGRLVTQAADTITITVTGTGESPSGRIVFNEIQYNPAVPGTEFLEFYNTSPTTAFDLSGYRINGLGFTFPEATVISPDGYLVIASDVEAFGWLYGFTIPVAARFDGMLSNGGEALSLVAPDGTNVVANIRYDSIAPWPSIADGTGASLQLIDSRQDATRVANWGAQPGVATPGAINSAFPQLTMLPRLWVNEVRPQNLDGIVDSAGEREPWVEIYNSGTTNVALSGYSLTDDFAQLAKWAFPAGTSIGAGERKIIWLDGETEESTAAELHANFRAAAVGGSVSLAAGNRVLDYLSYESLPAGLSYGAYPDGQAVWRDAFHRVTPGAPNDVTQPPVRVLINEWMTSNSRTIQDPDDLDFDDWFELYNPGSVAVDLAGYTLTDDAGNPDQTVIPSGTVIPPGGFLLVWADNENATNGQLHVSFRLSAEGDRIELYAPDGSLMDSVVFGSIPRDVSGGRLTDGGSITNALSVATPGFSNGGSTGGIAFSAVAISNGQVLLTWQTGSGGSFVVEYKNSLVDPVWTQLRTVAGSGGTASTTDAAGERHRFYRILQP